MPERRPDFHMVKLPGGISGQVMIVCLALFGILLHC